MTPEKKITIEDVGGDFGFRVQWSASESWADFDVYEIISHNGDKPLFDGDGMRNVNRSVDNIESADKYMTGFVKWDGCAEIKLDNHFCGPLFFKKHMSLMRYIYIRAMQLMNSDEMPWGDNTMPDMTPIEVK